MSLLRYYYADAPHPHPNPNPHPCFLVYYKTYVQEQGNIQNCTNYHGIELMNHTKNLWERMIEHRLRYETIVLENQFGFILGQSTMEAIYLLKRLMEKYRGL